ncbi:ABC transporter permease [Sphingobacterium hungaricum]|uniref:ABC transport system permease protein n=1 Tax=Sphingobacterium hungaricum TaxID=2082723 RepID=A0A928V1T5_9SPHI|nr:ABC transporter permease [Sphingobacterium hungaricum]MBE8715565.1 hypothetical protein [Sphingobacterium hungaricum]
MNFKIAWRNLFKNKYYTLINVFGLTISLVFVLLIASYVYQAHQVNSSVKNLDNQYILQSKYQDPSMGLPLTTIGALPKTLKEDYPDLVANYYRMDGITCVVSNDELVYEESAAIGDSTFLDMFGFELLDGDAKSALTAPFSVVITEDIAVKYFSNTDAVGKNLSIRNFDGQTHDFTVTAVLKSLEDNSVTQLTASMNNKIFLPLANQEYFGRNIDSWENQYIVGFIELQKNVNPDQLTLPIKNTLKKHAEESISSNLNPDLKPLNSYYLADNNGAVSKIINALTLTAFFLLLMAVINFINISMSQSLNRLKEVGVRKIMGINKIQLGAELISEYILIVFIASLFALLSYPIVAPLFSSVMGKEVFSLRELPFSIFVYYFIGVFLVGVLSGLYPAFKLSNTNVIYDIKGKFSGNTSNAVLKKSLLFFQFVVAIVVLTMSIVISKQVNLFLNGDLGFDKNFLFTVQVPRDWSEQGLQHIETVQNELKTLPQVEGISLSYDIPGMIGNGVQKIKKIDQEQTIDVQLISSDKYFADTYKIPLLAGKFFSDTNESSTDLSKVVISKKTAEDLGYKNPQEAIGKQIALVDGTFLTTISGVTDDFQPTSMHSNSPAILWFDLKNSNQYRFFSIRIPSANVSQSIKAIQEKWKALLPNSPFEIKFLDERINEMYVTELQFKNASKIATLISVIIVALSIIGLTSLTVNQRIKEIGIRRVLGASIQQIIRIFAKDFIGIFTLALLVASPVAYYLMQNWLDNYAVKTSLNAPIFVYPVLALLFVIITFMSVIIIRATLINPVRNLRDE